MYFVLKILLSAFLIATISEIGKRSILFASILAALPLTSLLSFLWLYFETGDTARIANLSRGILWALLPSCVFLIMLPFFLFRGMKFGWAMSGAALLTCGAYWIYIFFLKKIGISF